MTIKTKTQIVLSSVLFIALASLYIYLGNAFEKVIGSNSAQSMQGLSRAVQNHLRTVMNTGDPVQIESVKQEIREFPAILRLEVHRSAEVNAFYSPDRTPSQDKDVLEVFASQKSLSMDVDFDGQHAYRLVRPMIAEQECLACHSNAQQGQVLGVMELVRSMKSSDDRIASSKTGLLIGMVLFMLLVSGVLGIFFERQIIKPLNQLKTGLEDFFAFLSRKKETTEPMKILTKDEFGQMSDQINHEVWRIQEGILQDREAIRELTRDLEMASQGFMAVKIDAPADNPHLHAAIEAVYAMFDNVRYSVTLVMEVLQAYAKADYGHPVPEHDLKGSLGSLMAGMTVLGQSSSGLLAIIDQYADKLQSGASDLSSVSEELASSSEQQSVAVTDSAKRLEYFSEAIQEISEQSKQAVSQTSEVSLIVNSIRDIAEQTNLLSLNAAIEASRAGEHGRGFAVVADEVRQLAEKTQKSLADIETVIKTISQTIYDIDERISDQADGVIKVSEGIKEVDLSAKETTKAADLISKRAGELLHIAQEFNALVDQTTYDPKAKDRICEPKLIFELSQRKIEHILFKESNYTDLVTQTEAWKVTDANSCNLGHWITEQDKTPVAKQEQWKTMKEIHHEVHAGVQEFVEAYVQGADAPTLMEIAGKIERHTLDIFKRLDAVKAEMCREKEQEKSGSSNPA